MDTPCKEVTNIHMSADTSDTSHDGKNTVNNFNLIWPLMLSKTQTMLVNLGTLPYYVFFNQNTYIPIVRIAKIVTDAEPDEVIVRKLTHWRTRKLYEMHFIQVASAILAGGVIGCLQWTSPLDTYWLGPALWYCSLVSSILAMLLSSSQAFIFDSLNVPTEEEGSNRDYRCYLPLIVHCRTKVIMSLGEEGSSSRKFKEWVPRWKMVFIWQCPMMFMAYAVCFFLVGLTLFVCTALINGENKTGAAKTAYFYLVVTAITLGIFMYCSFWGYKYVDLDKDRRDD